MLGKATNPLLQQTEQGIQEKVPANLQPGLQRVVSAGLTLIYSPALHQRMVEKLESTPNPAENAALGAVNIVGTLFNQSKGSMPLSIAAPAAIILMCEILDFVAQAGKIQITPELVSQAAQSASEHTLAMLKISKDQIHHVVAHGMSAAHDHLNAAAGAPDDSAQPGSAPAAAPSPGKSGIINSSIGVQ